MIPVLEEVVMRDEEVKDLLGEMESKINHMLNELSSSDNIIESIILLREINKVAKNKGRFERMLVRAA